MFLLLILIIIALNYGIYEKEQIKKHCEIVLLKLFPADPRSIMQGDYMHLGYDIERKIPNKKLKKKFRGHIVVNLDENKIAKLVRLYKQEKLSQGEKLFRYHYKWGWYQIVPNTFFFQEGHADFYQDARYGIFKFANTPGKYLLVGLADSNKQEINPNKK